MEKILRPFETRLTKLDTDVAKDGTITKHYEGKSRIYAFRPAKQKDVKGQWFLNMPRPKTNADKTADKEKPTGPGAEIDAAIAEANA